MEASAVGIPRFATVPVAAFIGCGTLHLWLSQGALWAARDDGPGRDLGYPSSVELADGSVFTVYYQQDRVGGQCALLWTRWFLPD